MDIKEQLERWKILAEAYAKEDKRVLIKDIEDNWYFADILIVGEEKITIQCYAPEQRAGQKFYLYWANIKEFELAKEDAGK
jgi:hypothetical protein